MLGSRAEHIYLDGQSYPDKYDARGLALAEALVVGSRKLGDLTPDEQQLLNLATVDFATAPAPSKKKQEPTKLMKKAEMREPAVEDFSEMEMSPYWWL